jgi:hypothetical protein
MPRNDDAVRLRLSELAALFAIGAAGGLVGDAGHVQAGTTTYIDDSLPFVWESALWFPVLVGLGTASLGEIRLRLAPPRSGFDLRAGVGGIAAVIGIYALTAIVYEAPELPVIVLIATLAALVAAWLADGAPALICGLLAAAVGPVVEIVVTGADLSAYHESADGLFGVAPWLVPLYFAFGVVVARLAELAVARRSA